MPSSSSPSPRSLHVHVQHDERVRTALVAFPQGVPLNVKDMTVAVQEKISSRDSNSSSSSSSSSSSHRSKRKRSVVGSLENVQYSSGGSSDSAKNDVYKYALGVIDESNGQLLVMQVDHPYALRPQLQLKPTMSIRDNTMMSRDDRTQSLTEAFESKK